MQLKLFAAACLLFLSSLVFAQTVTEVLASDGRFSQLVDALELAALVDELDAKGPFTVFAPTDEAFAALPQEQLAALLGDPQALMALLGYHIVGERLTDDELAERTSIETISGEMLPVDIGSPGATGVSISGLNEVQGTLDASNGAIYVLGSVLVPASLEGRFAAGTPEETQTAEENPAVIEVGESCL